MNSMNQVTLIGKVTFEPQVRELKSGSKAGSFGMGISESFQKDGEWETRMNFVEVVLWNQQAETAKKRLAKGDLISVQGSLQYEQWEKDGKKQSKLRVRAQRVQKLKLEQEARAVQPAEC